MTIFAALGMVLEPIQRYATWEEVQKNNHHRHLAGAIRHRKHDVVHRLFFSKYYHQFEKWDFYQYLINSAQMDLLKETITRWTQYCPSDISEHLLTFAIGIRNLDLLPAIIYNMLRHRYELSKPFQELVEQEDLELCKIFIQNCGTVLDGYTNQLIKQDDNEKIKFLLKAGLNCFRPILPHGCFLKIALEHNAIKSFQAIAQKTGQEPINTHNLTIAHMVAQTSAHDIAKTYFSKTNVNSLDKLNRTPLHHAAYHNQIEMANILLSNGANHMETRQGMYPIHCAIVYALDNDEFVNECWVNKFITKQMLQITIQKWPHKTQLIKSLTQSYIYLTCFKIWSLNQTKSSLSKYIIKDMFEFL